MVRLLSPGGDRQGFSCSDSHWIKRFVSSSTFDPQSSLAMGQWRGNSTVEPSPGGWQNQVTWKGKVLWAWSKVSHKRKPVPDQKAMQGAHSVTRQDSTLILPGYTTGDDMVNLQYVLSTDEYQRTQDRSWRWRGRRHGTENYRKSFLWLVQ